MTNGMTWLVIQIKFKCSQCHGFFVVLNLHVYMWFLCQHHAVFLTMVR